MAEPITPVELEEIQPEEGADYDVQLESLSQWQLAWRRFKRHRMAVIGSALFLGMVVIGILGPLLVPYDYYKVPTPDTIVHAGRPPSLVPFRPFGETAGLQISVFTLVVNGVRWSLLIGVIATAIAAFLGTLVGGIAGFYGGRLDSILMRTVDALLALPLLFVILVFTRFLGSGSWVSVTVIFGVFGWPGISRLVRSLMLTLREEDYVDAARAAGVSTRRIIFRHLLPNALSPIIVVSTLSVAAVIIGEAFVSFLGYGVGNDTPTLGNILAGSLASVSLNWWWAFFPGLAIVIIVLGINFMGDGLQDALDPRAKA
ncbi:MAG: ABC transporter permease [Candidatus Dormibacteraeota bacterium]|nr:ABC transporter permease [Candidatus Dormibacteraeota bacterium]